MEDQVPFKVFTFWKQNDKPEVRRFGVEKTVVTSFHYLNAKLQDVYPGLKGKAYSVAWKDEDGDDVVVSSDEEVMTALQALNGDVIKLYVYCKSDESKNEGCDILFAAVSGNANDPNPDPSAVHYGVMCDSCDTTIVGFRYKCTSCEDFDLCSRCEAAGHHPEHCMVRVPTPSMPRAIIRAAIKRSRHFLKTVATAMGEECPYKKHRSDKSGERRHRGPHHPGHPGPHGGERSDHAGHREHHRRHRVSWLDTFSTYMNEFANLAGDINLDDGKPKAPEATTQEQTSATQDQNPQAGQEKAQSTTESAQAPKQPEPSTSAYAQTQIPALPINLDQIKGLLELYLGGNLNAFMPQQPQAPATQATPAPTPAANTAETTPAAPQWYPEMGQGDSKKQDDEVTMHTATSSVSSLTENTRDASPDKVDDWTVINKEKDMMDATSANTGPAAPIGFNLPEEFQDRVKISDGSIYPPLNTSTAVPEVKNAQASAPPTPAPVPKPAAQKPTASAAQPQPRQRHPMAHIDAAIQQMLAMGFTNEGGWLTQLLESKDGNIAAVLDLLTPVHPKK